jgi:hypothetical protein
MFVKCYKLSFYRKLNLTWKIKYLRKEMKLQFTSFKMSSWGRSLNTIELSSISGDRFL